MLGRIAADLKETFAHVNHSGEYQDKLTRLHRQLLAVHLLAGAYVTLRWSTAGCKVGSCSSRRLSASRKSGWTVIASRR